MFFARSTARSAGHAGHGPLNGRSRTLLAWVRTGIGLVGLGFVVARFALFAKLVWPDIDHPAHLYTAAVGVALAGLGALAAAIATWQHRRFCATLGAHELPPNYRVQPAIWLGFGVALAGLVLAVVIAT